MDIMKLNRLFSLNKMSSNILIILWTIFALSNCVSTVRSVSIDNVAYKDIVIEIRDYVPVEKCADFLLDLEVCFYCYNTLQIFLFSYCFFFVSNLFYAIISSLFLNDLFIFCSTQLQKNIVRTRLKGDVFEIASNQFLLLSFPLFTTFFFLSKICIKFILTFLKFDEKKNNKSKKKFSISFFLTFFLPNKSI